MPRACGAFCWLRAGWGAGPGISEPNCDRRTLSLMVEPLSRPTQSYFVGKLVQFALDKAPPLLVYLKQDWEKHLRRTTKVL